MGRSSPYDIEPIGFLLSKRDYPEISAHLQNLGKLEEFQQGKAEIFFLCLLPPAFSFSCCWPKDPSHIVIRDPHCPSRQKDLLFYFK